MAAAFETIYCQRHRIENMFGRLKDWRRNGVMTSTGVIGTVCGYHAYPLILWYLAQQIRQHRCITNVIAGDLNGPNFQRLCVDPKL